MPPSAGVRAMTALARTMAGYALAALVGYVCFLEHMPLAWMLGPLFTAAVLSMTGFELKPHGTSRRVGQLAVGASVGLNMTGPILLELVRWLPLMVASIGVSVLFSAAVSVGLARFARIDQTSAFFACLPGGLSEMSNTGAKVGARPEPVALVQILRVTLTVCLIPPVLIGFGADGVAPAGDIAFISHGWVAALFVGGAAMAALLHMLRLNNPFTIGAIIFAAAMTSSGLLAGRMPSLVFFAGQLLIGFVIGARFRPNTLSMMPRVTVFGSLSVLVLLAAMGGYAGLLTAATGLGFPIALLAVSPGGMAEMAATAQILHLAVPTVVAFQVTRGLMVNAFATHFHTLMTRVGVFAAFQRLLGKPADD